jgi:hypothetical protein
MKNLGRIFLLLLSVSGLSIIPASQLQAAEAGKALLTVGSVFSVRGSGKVALKRRSPVFEKDEVHVGSGGRAQLRMIDSALISLQQNSVLQIKKYTYKPGGQGNSAFLELLSGGLRTITGAIGKANKKAYELRTPLATIGIRGTDYEVEIVPNGMYVGVWSGVIHLRSLLRNGCSMELGTSRRFSFIFIDRFGQCKGLDTAPDVFTSGHSYPPVILPELKSRPVNALTIDQGRPASNGAGTASTLNSATPTFNIGNKLLNNSHSSASDFKQNIAGYPVSWGYWGQFNQSALNGSPKTVTNSTGSGLLWTAYGASSAESVLARSGTAQYDTVVDSLVSSSQGAVSNLSVQMEVNFDTGNVSNGALSANTPSETWVGVFDGKVQNGDLSLQLNGASVVDSNPATLSLPRAASGFIDGDFVGNRAQGVVGAFGLSEDNNSANHVEGVFVVE